MSRATSAVDTGVARIRCVQLAPVVGDLAGNRDLILGAVREAKAARVDVLVLPELAASGYVFTSKREASSVAITAEHPLFADIADELAFTTAIVVVGFCERGERDVLFNSAAVISAAGVLAVYRKTHLWDREKLFFTPGTGSAPIVDTPHGRMGVLICYDLEFPEMPRSLALDGADFIAVPTNWPLGTTPAGEHPAEIILAMAAARSNGVFIACCDRAGTERDVAWTEGTVIIDQFGWILDRPTGDGSVATADIFPALARDKAISARNDLMADRRPLLYSRLQSSPTES